PLPVGKALCRSPMTDRIGVAAAIQAHDKTPARRPAGLSQIGQIRVLPGVDRYDMVARTRAVLILDVISQVIIRGLRQKVIFLNVCGVARSSLLHAERVV